MYINIWKKKKRRDKYGRDIYARMRKRELENDK